MSSHENRCNIASPRAASTPKRQNDSSAIILSLPVRKGVTPTWIFTELKKKNVQIPKSIYIKNIFSKYFEENVCLFTKHRLLKEVKSENCYGCENGFQDHVCPFETVAEWIEIFYKEIIGKSDIQMIKILSKHRLYEYFRREEVESVVSLNLILQMNDSWIAKLKSKMKTLWFNLQQNQKKLMKGIL